MTAPSGCRHSIEQSPEAVLVYDPATLRVVDANQAACALYGYARGDLMERRLEDLRPESEIPFLYRALADDLHGERTRRNAVRHRRRDGSIFEAEIVSHPLHYEGRALRLISVRDVTTERERQRASQRQALLFQGTSDAVMLTDTDGRVTDWNPAAERLFGWTRDEALGRVADFVLGPDANGPRFDTLIAAVRADGSWEDEVVARRKDGESRVCEIRAVPLLDENGEMTGVIAMGRDVTERRTMTRALQETERRYRILAEQLPHIVWMADAQGSVEVYNRHWAEYTGIPAECGRGRGWRVALHPEDESKTIAAWEHSIRTGAPYSIEHRLRSRDGSYRWHLSRGTPMRDDEGRIVRWHGSATDIHDQKMGEAAIREREAYFRSVFEHAHDAILLFDETATRVIDANPQAEALYGYGREAFRGISFLDLCVEPARTVQHLGRLRADDSVGFEVQQRTRSGATVWVEVNATPMEYDGHRVILAISRDVTERRQLQRQLRQAQKMEAIGRLAGGLAHDFNNLITAIQGFAGLLAEKLETKTVETTDALEEIEAASRRASDLTRQMLAYTRQQVLRPQVLDLNAVVDSASQILRRLIGEDVTFEVDPSPDLGAVKADPVQLQQVLMNLAINARDAMPAGGRLRIETGNVVLDEAFAAEHPPSTPGRFVRLRVSDTGQGMDAGTLQQVFEPFFTTKPMGEGTGLGLSTVYGIVKQSGGYIWADSEPGVGTTFDIYLPPCDRPVETVGAGAESETGREGTPTVGGGAVVLLVEDEAGVRKLARKVLERAGFTVKEAADGPRALRLLDSGVGGEVDVLLTDMVMPGMSGKTLAAEVARRRPDVRVLFMSGYTGESLAERAEVDRADEVLEKPFAPRELVRAVQRVMEATESR